MTQLGTATKVQCYKLFKDSPARADRVAKTLVGACVFQIWRHPHTHVHLPSHTQTHTPLPSYSKQYNMHTIHKDGDH